MKKVYNLYVSLFCLLICIIILFFISGCASKPGPPAPYMGGKELNQIITELDKIDSFGDYPKMPGFEQCERPANIGDLYSSGKLEVNTVSITDITDVCMCGLNTSVKMLMYSLGGPVPVFGCMTYDYVEDCKPQGARVFAAYDEHNSFLTHELMHVKGFGDDYYPSVEWDESKCEGIR